MAALFVIGTPIGNLEDITYRALRILKEVDVILCEDTRTTQNLLKHYQITDKKLSAYNDQKSGISAEKTVAWLAGGLNLALVTDAGMPGISDPGSILVKAVREKLPEVKIESVPGPSALTSALSISGLLINDFVFLGFLPHKKGRETLFKEIASMERAAIFYESPHRILRTLKSLAKYAPNKEVTVARELTKIYEQVVTNSAVGLLEYFEANPDKVRGEFVVTVN